MSERAVVIERPGLQTIVIDPGRFGLRHQGIAWCGPMDAGAYAIANRLLGNDSNAAALEVVLGDLVVTFTAAARCAITGAPCALDVDGVIIESWASFDATAGSRLTIGRPLTGMRTIVAFDGGIDVPVVLGSRTTDLMAKFGGQRGRALRASDVLALGLASPGERIVATAPVWDAKVRVVVEPGYAQLCAHAWTIGHQSNRMAVRLHGERIESHAPAAASRGVFPGMIQLPPQGEPIVLAADAQTTGGYPIAGTVVEDDLWKLAQAPLGSSVQLVPV